tara:strand:+ start:185 stop:547 length:363 start_codon:yes stop_codon:yes gene_type:complete
MSYRHFSLSEFDSPDLPGSGQNMRAEFLRVLDEAREISGIAYYINSGYRTEAENKKCGGVENSAHLTGWAADIRATTSGQRMAIVMGLIEAGINRIGIGQNFVHADNCPTKAPTVLWLYS